MWAAIGMVVAAIVGAVAAVLMTPNVKNEGAKPVGLDDFNVPTNSNGRVIPIVFGTVELKGNCLWYGDLRSSEIKA